MDTHGDTSAASASPLSPELPSQPLLLHLVDAASTIPRSALPAGKGHLVLSVVFSPSRPTKALYPWAHLDDPRGVAQGLRPFPARTIQTWEEMVFFHAEWRRDDEHEDDAKMIMAIEGYHYTLPEHGTAVFYLSKLDTTGWGPRLNHPSVRRQLASIEVQQASAQSASSSHPSSSQGDPSKPEISSLTGHLTEHFLSYFMSLRHMARLPVDCIPPRHISLHILARAQGAYIFPNSPDNPLKKPLTDAKLIVWWRHVVSKVVELIRWYEKREAGVGQGASMKRIDAFYMIPGMDKLESHPLIPLPQFSQDAAVKKVGWAYGHPYTTAGAGAGFTDSSLPPLPLFPGADFRNSGDGEEHSDSTKGRSIATLMPRFEDDPQSRFMDELASEGHEVSAFGDLLRRSDSGGSSDTAVSDRGGAGGTASAKSSSSRSSSRTTSYSLLSSQTVIPDDAGVDSKGEHTGDSNSGNESYSLPQTPSKRMRRTRSGADSPYNIEGDDASNRGSPTPTAMRSSPRLREKERQRSASKSPVKSAASAGATHISRLSPAKAPSPLVPLRSRTSSSTQSATEIYRSSGLAKANGNSSTNSVPSPGAAEASLPTKAPAPASTTSGTRLTNMQMSALRSRLSLDSVSPDEFWMRMGYRQECSSGSLVGCFFLGVTKTSPSSWTSVPAQPRSRFTIPLRDLQKTMRSELQLDDCYWNLPRDSIELTQYFDEERGRLLAHTGRLHPEEKDEDRLRAIRGARRTRATSKGELVIEGGEKTKKVSKKHAKRNTADEDWIWRIGETVVWRNVPLVGYSETMLQRAKEKAAAAAAAAALEEEGKGGLSTEMARADAQDVTTAPVKPVVRMLSVKRKKKA